MARPGVRLTTAITRGAVAITFTLAHKTNLRLPAYVTYPFQ
jgi:hypothetical protein